MKDIIVSRLREPSTYAGVAAVLAGITFLPHAADVAQTVTVVGTAIAGLLAIWLPETRK